jgi:hypothetical protein
MRRYPFAALVPRRCVTLVSASCVTSDNPVYVNQAGRDRTGLTLMPINRRFLYAAPRDRDMSALRQHARTYASHDDWVGGREAVGQRPPGLPLHRLRPQRTRGPRGGCPAEGGRVGGPLPRERPRERAQQDTETDPAEYAEPYHRGVSSCVHHSIGSWGGPAGGPPRWIRSVAKMINEGRRRGCERAHTSSGPFLTGGGVMLWAVMAMADALSVAARV